MANLRNSYVLRPARAAMVFCAPLAATLTLCTRIQRFWIIASTLLLAGCASTTPPVEQLKPPSARLMQPAQSLPEVQAGDDLYAASVQCRGEYSRETGKLNSLQGYVRTITKKK